MKHLTIVAGARPNFMKIAPIIHAIQQTDIQFNLVHTGQHYDKKMSDDFFEQLEIPQPTTNLQVGSGTQAEQTAAIMIGFEKFLLNNPTDLVIVVGDVTSTMACAIVAKKLHILVAHVEAGIRSYDKTMPEEINRIVTDSITDYFFTTSNLANIALQVQGVEPNDIFFVGNTMIDTLLKNQHKFKKPLFWNSLDLKEQEYIVITLHRPANVDDPKQLSDLLDAIVTNSNNLPILFPVHPRTRKVIDTLNLSYDNLHLIDPMSYLEFNYLVKHSKLVITDSGGITEETTVMHVPCMTLRDNTERPETITYGTNELVGTDHTFIKPYMDKLFAGEWKRGSIPPKWDGKTAERIINIIKEL
jgi:UDP-N-acetylglucosamine 2-epimerase (non-hydrolysing)